MLFTQKQIREEIGVEQETYRHWAKHIPALARRAGRAASHTWGDMLALAFTKELYDRFGVRISSIAPALNSLFIQLNERPWVGLSGAWLRITEAEAAVVSAGSGSAALIPGQHAILLDCDPVLQRIRAAMMSAEPDQLRFAFGPRRLPEVS